MEQSPIKATAFKSILLSYLMKYLLVTQLQTPDPVFQIVHRLFHNSFEIF